MARQLHLKDHPEKIDHSAFIAPNATIVGDVRVGKNCSVWYAAVLRGDTEPITIGESSNIQDGCIVHADPGTPTMIGKRVTVGHGAIVHGAIVEDDVLIGMRATILNGARIGSGSIVAAGALVTENAEIPPNSLVIGVPAKVRGETTDEHRAMIVDGARHYAEAGKAYRDKQHSA